MSDKRSVAIDPQRMKLAEYDRQEWVANAPPGATLEDAKKPEFWSLMAMRMRPYDRVEIRADDGTWIAEALVLGADRTWAKIHILSEHKLTTRDVSLTQAALHEVKWRGPHNRWSVVRLSDSMVVKEHCETKEDAAFWLKEHEKTTQ